MTASLEGGVARRVAVQAREPIVVQQPAPIAVAIAGLPRSTSSHVSPVEGVDGLPALERSTSNTSEASTSSSASSSSSSARVAAAASIPYPAMAAKRPLPSVHALAQSLSTTSITRPSASTSASHLSIPHSHSSYHTLTTPLSPPYLSRRGSSSSASSASSADSDSLPPPPPPRSAQPTLQQQRVVSRGAGAKAPTGGLTIKPRGSFANLVASAGGWSRLMGGGGGGGDANRGAVVGAKGREGIRVEGLDADQRGELGI